jgi:H+/Cl- antiporter ClcA
MENPYNGRLSFNIGRLSSNLESYDEELLHSTSLEKLEQISKGILIGLFGGVIGYVIAKKMKKNARVTNTCLITICVKSVVALVVYFSILFANASQSMGTIMIVCVLCVFA